MSLVYKDYSADKIYVLGDRKIHTKAINKIGGRWNSSLKDMDPGWLLPVSKRAELEKYIDSLSPRPIPQTLDEESQEGEQTRTPPRPLPATPPSDPPTKEPEDTKLVILTNKKNAKPRKKQRAYRRAVSDSESEPEDTLRFYRRFAKSPKKREMEYALSDSEDSESSGFPTPNEHHSPTDIRKLSSRISDIQHKIVTMESTLCEKR
jgi:outer membrane biosynthesis protein TonB